jgi:AraC-like DNA-binding protein
MEAGATVAVQEVRVVVATAAARGVDRRTLLGRAGIDADALADGEERVPQSSFHCLVEHAVDASGDRHLGLHAAERSVRGHWLPDPLHYALLSCPTVGEQLETASRYARLLHAGAVATYANDGATAWVTYDLPGCGALARRHLTERWLGGLVLLAGRLAGTAVRPREVWFRHPATPDVSPHRRIFGAALRFEQEVDAILMGPDALEIRVPTGDPRLLRVLDTHLSMLLPEVEPVDVAELVRRTVRDSPPGRRPAIGAVADALAMSPRSLQRLLGRAGTSYHRLVADVQEDLARQLMVESRLSPAEIAFTLGYSDASTFHRAFKRWTAQTPLGFRRAAARAGARGQWSGAHGQDTSRSRT